jgi:methylated-DNA-[protein]-cysteine S-methyltransferase
MDAQAVAGCDFDTPIGRCALAWRGDQLWQVRLAAGHSGAPDAPPPWVAEVITRIQALLGGEAARFDDVPLAWPRVPAFHRRVYELARAIAPGATRTYGELARELGDPGAARAVGQALGQNPWPIVVPCHRVLAAAGGLGGFSAPGGGATKLRLLEIERAWPGDQPSLFGR